MRFEVSGKIKLRSEERKFCILIDAKSENHARDKAMAYLGSKYGANRNSISIESLKKGA